MKSWAPFAVLLYVIAANVPIWIAGHWLGLTVHGLFGVEFLVVGVLSAFLWPAVTAVLLCAAILVDLLRCISKTYLFSVSELLRSAPSAREFAPSHVWSILTIVLTSVAVCAGAFLASREVRRDERQYAVPLILSTFLALCVFADVGRGQITLLNPDRQMGSIRLARVSVGALLWEARQYRKIECLARLQQDSRTVGASSKLPVWMKSSSVRRNQPNIVLVMVESWGQPVSRDIGDALLAPYKDASISRAYKMETGVVSFHGPTIDAETRELCSDELGFGVITAPASSFRDCLPMRLARLGYYTTAVHGFSGRMFKRDDWYRKARFDEAWFREQLQPRGLSMCPGPFPGICDAAVGEWIGNRLEEGRNAPQFIYWVTLNSHLPVPVPNQVEDSPSCSGSAEISDSAAECSWYQLVYNVHRSVSKLAAKVASRPTMFVIVGDHAPPFSQPELRERFSESVVPYIVLSSKYGAADAPLQLNRSIASRSNHQAGYAKHHKKKTEPASSAEGGENTGGA